MRRQHRILVAIASLAAFVASAAPAWSQVKPSAPSTSTPPLRDRGRTVVVSAAAPIFLRPNVDLDPLRVAKEGSTLRLIEQGPEWTLVEFQDPQFGRRGGYIQTKFVDITPEATPEPTVLAPLDLSVPA